MDRRRNKTALRLWLTAVAGLRVYGIYLAGWQLPTYSTEVYNLQPDQVTDAFGRLVVSWTFMSLVCCLLSVWNPWNSGVRLASMFSFANATTYFAVEYAMGVASFDKILRPLCVAVPSLLWLAADWWLDAAAPPKKRQS